MDWSRRIGGAIGVLGAACAAWLLALTITATPAEAPDEARLALADAGAPVAPDLPALAGEARGDAGGAPNAVPREDGPQAAGGPPAPAPAPDEAASSEEVAEHPAVARYGPDPLDAWHPAVRSAIEVQDRHTAMLMDDPSVVATAVGLTDDGELAVVVMTTAGVPGALPVSLDGVPVIVWETGEIVATHHRPGHDRGPGGGNGDDDGGDDGDGDGDGDDDDDEPTDPTARFPRPVPIGVSTGHPDITAGTIGCRVVDGSGHVYALSNNHIYADSNAADVGDQVLQPGPYDGGVVNDDTIGTLDAYVEIVFDGEENEVDAAIAAAIDGKLGNATPADGYGTPKSKPVAAALRQNVQKYGRTTGLTTGRVDAINVTVNVGFDEGTALFVNQIAIRPGSFSRGGDSGSLVVSSDRDPVGLLFAGGSGVTIANPIDAVLRAFDVTIDGE